MLWLQCDRRTTRNIGHERLIRYVSEKRVPTCFRERDITWNWASSASPTPANCDAPSMPKPLRCTPELYSYDLNLADIAEVWRRGSDIASWLPNLAASALLDSPALAKFVGRVSDSGKGRWTIAASIDESIPAPVLSAALYERFGSRGEADFADKLLSALRYEFGGHEEKAAAKQGGAG